MKVSENTCPVCDGRKWITCQYFERIDDFYELGIGKPLVDCKNEEAIKYAHNGIFIDICINCGVAIT